MLCMLGCQYIDNVPKKSSTGHLCRGCHHPLMPGVVTPRYRLVVDESLALGVLGARGRGACEHWGLAPGEVEIVAASMGAPGWLFNSCRSKDKYLCRVSTPN